MSYVKCDFGVGDMVVPLTEEFAKIFKCEKTLKQILASLGNGGKKILKIKNYACTCPEKNGGQHGCMLKDLGCNQVIYLESEGEVKPFAGCLFRKATPLPIDVF